VLGPATEITSTSALLHATVNIEGLRADVCDLTSASEAEVTILAHNDAGTTHTTSSAATIHLKAKHG
jgi:hypothetical protein